MADLSTPFHRPPSLNGPPPLLPPDSGAPTTDDGPYGTRRVPAPSPGRPGLNRQNSMDFLDGEQGPDLSSGRRKVLNLSARLQQTSRAPNHPSTTASGRSLSFTPTHSSSFASFLDGPPPPPSAPAPAPPTSAPVEIKVSPASPYKGQRQQQHRMSLRGPPSPASGGLEAGVELSAPAKPSRKGKTRARAPPKPAPALPPSALGRQCTTAMSSPTSSATRLSTSLINAPLAPLTFGAPSSSASSSATALAAPPAPAAQSERRAARPSTMMRRSSSARDVNPLVRAAASKAITSLSLAKTLSSTSAVGSSSGSGGDVGSGGEASLDGPLTPPPESDPSRPSPEAGASDPTGARGRDRVAELTHTRVIRSKPRITRSTSLFGGLDGGHAIASSAPVSPKSRSGGMDCSSSSEPVDDDNDDDHEGDVEHGNDGVRATVADGPEVLVPRSKRAKRSPSPPGAASTSNSSSTRLSFGGALEPPSTSTLAEASHLPSPPHPSPPPLLHATHSSHSFSQPSTTSGPPTKPSPLKPRPAALSFGPSLSVLSPASDGGLASPFCEAAVGGSNREAGGGGTHGLGGSFFTGAQTQHQQQQGGAQDPSHRRGSVGDQEMSEPSPPRRNAPLGSAFGQ